MPSFPPRSWLPDSVVLVIPISKVTTPSEISFFICASAGVFKSLSDQFNDMEGGACRAFPILPILCLILSDLLILCTIRSGKENSRKEVKRSEKARAEDRQVGGDGSEDGTTHQDCSSCSIGRRAFDGDYRFASLSPNRSHGMLSRGCGAQPDAFRTGKEAHEPWRNGIPLWSFLIFLVLDRCSH